MQAPFKVGDRVRATPETKQLHPGWKCHVGFVKKLTRWGPDEWGVSVLLDGYKTLKHLRAIRWELVPPVDMSLDEVGQSLAHAVLTGDNTAALALADRVIEMLRG